MTKADVLRSLTFGGRVAEDESEQLSSYFVETDLWRRIFVGEVDVVQGPKGSGKSAIYSLLQSRSQELADRGVFVLTGENPRGATVFSDLVVDPPTTEREFQALWKLYLLSLVGVWLRNQAVQSDRATDVVRLLTEEGLIEANAPLARMFRTVRDYVRRLSHPEAVEGGVKVDPITGAPAGITGKITFREPSTTERQHGRVSVDSLFALANDALADIGQTVWLLLDRLDVAFAESAELEGNALRALFKVYLDLLGHRQICLKVFLRTDIMRRITRQGFRELSHITRTATITWDEASLKNLVIRRALRNEALKRFYGVEEDVVLHDVDEQERLFYRLFPQQVEAGEKRRSTWTWLLSRTADGTHQTAPRELIHLLSAARGVQLRRMEVGHDEPPDEALFEGAAFKEALGEVSRVRLTQTLYPEYPHVRRNIEALEGERTQQSRDSLARLWHMSDENALAIANELVELGFFEQRSAGGNDSYWVPFLYRPALNMVQGAAE